MPMRGSSVLPSCQPAPELPFSSPASGKVFVHCLELPRRHTMVIKEMSENFSE